MTNMCT